MRMSVLWAKPCVRKRGILSEKMVTVTVRECFHGGGSAVKEILSKVYAVKVTACKRLL